MDVLLSSFNLSSTVYFPTASSSIDYTTLGGSWSVLFSY